MQLLLQNIHGHVHLLNSLSLFLRFRQSTLINLLVLIQWYGIYLHCHCGNHVGRFLVENEVVESFNIHLTVTNYVGCNKLATAFLIKCLNCSILNSRELTDDTFHLLELNAKTTYFHLTIATTHKLDVATRQVAHDVARAVDAAVFLIARERVVNVDLGCLLGTVEVATTHLRSCHPQLSRSSHRKPMLLRINNVKPHVLQRLADGDVLVSLVDYECGRKNRTLGGTIHIVEFIPGGRSERSQLLTAGAEVQ